MEAKLLRFPHKKIRAAVIKEYMKGVYSRAVCFSCGNAATELEKAGVDVLHIGAHGVLAPQVWFTQVQVQHTFPGYFDATSGHLPIELMQQVGNAYRTHLGQLSSPVYVPSGSGETVVCLKLAYPEIDFVAVYNLDEATEYSPHAPLNNLVKLLCKGIILDGRGRD